MPAQVTEHGLLSGDCPVAADVGSNGDSYYFLKQQANPSHNLMAQAAADPSDARYGRPAVTGLDTQLLLYATVKKRRFLTNMTASCVPGEGSAAEDIHITLQLAGGDGQNAGTVDALPVVICSDRQRDVVADGIVGYFPRLLQHLERRLPLVLVIEVALGLLGGLVNRELDDSVHADRLVVHLAGCDDLLEAHDDERRDDHLGWRGHVSGGSARSSQVGKFAGSSHMRCEVKA